MGEAATAFLAVSAGVYNAHASVDSGHSDVGLSTRAMLRGSDRGLAALPAALPALPAPHTPRHSAGRPVPNLCGTLSEPPSALGVAVSHFDEDLGWLGDRRENATIYAKHADYVPEFASTFRSWVNLPNIGMETHTYLFHIVSRWDCLDDATLFTQGRADDSVDHYQGIDELFARTLGNPDGMILYRAPGTFNEWWGLWHFGKWRDELDSGVMRKSDRNPGEFWHWMFGEPPPETVPWTWSATFAVRREAIQRRPLRFYKRLLNHFETLNHTRPEEGHFMERFWVSVFTSNAGINRLRQQPPQG